MHLNKLKTLFTMAFIVAVAFIVPSIAVAAEDATFAIDFSSALSTIINLVFAAISAVAIWVVHKISNVLQEKTAIEIQSATRNYLIEAIHYGITFGQKQVMEKSSELTPAQVESEIIAIAANYIIDKVPDALTYFGLNDEEKLKELILSRLPELSAA